MSTITNVMHYVFPLLALLLLILGLVKKRSIYILTSLWLAFIALLLAYRHAGGEILGAYFDYKRASLYTLTLFILLVDLFYIGVLYLKSMNQLLRTVGGFLFACLAAGSTLLITNVWINARFIENRLPNTAVMQVVTFTPPVYCLNRHIFYTINSQGKVNYLCPNHYGFIAKTGELEVVPEFIVRQMAAQRAIHHQKSKDNQNNNPGKPK